MGTPLFYRAGLEKVVVWSTLSTVYKTVLGWQSVRLWYAWCPECSGLINSPTHTALEARAGMDMHWRLKHA